MMTAIEALMKLVVELNENGYNSDLLIEPAKKRLTLRCNLKAEDMVSLAKKDLPKEKTDSPFKARRF